MDRRRYQEVKSLRELFVKMRVGALVLVLALGWVLAACAQQDDGDGAAQGPAAGEEEHEEEEEEDLSAFGEPADAGDADRTVTITMTDALRFEPDEVEVALGETITFVLDNEGAIVHEFVIGDEEYQEHHEEEMQQMAEDGQMMMQDEPNTLVVQPGETGELTWHFTQPGEFLYGCHEPGHYPGGMVGTITVTEPR